MASADPLKTVLSLGNVDDTSLALPSAGQLSSGQRRVLEQVKTVARSRSRRSGSRSSASLSPTSPSYESVFGDALKSQSSTSNGYGFFGNGFSNALIAERSTNWQTVNSSVGSTAKRNAAYERRHAPLSPTAAGQANTSRSEPGWLWQRSVPKRSAPPRRIFSTLGACKTERVASQVVTNASFRQQQPHAVDGASQNKASKQFICSRSDEMKSTSQPAVVDGPPKNKADLRSNGSGGVADMTMKEAVECLAASDETHQNCGASYIQHNAFIEDKAKEEVLKLNGIPLLVSLLHSPSSQVSQTASAALRNLSFKSDSTKEAILRCGGVKEAVAVLRDTDSGELQKHLTGLLWNLSSADVLKPDLLEGTLPVLMERVILPYTAGPDQTSSISQEPEAFFHATGCLRNLSSANQSNRQAMRKCRGLVDSLVAYVKDCVKEKKTDDKSVENCVCILHNLTFQLEAEAPSLFSRITALARNVKRTNSQGDASPIGCFSPQNKSAEQEHHFDFPVVEDPQPTGAGWLFHSQTLQTYLSLLGSSQQEETREACCGAMQNLTAHEGIVSSVMSNTIVQKLNGLQVITPLLRSDSINLRMNIVALVKNLTRNRNLHSAIARKALPELLGLLSSGTSEGHESDDTLAMACQTANCLLMKEPEMGKRLLNSSLINSLNDISQNKYLPKSSKAAALFLYNLWSEKDLQSLLKKQGMNKSLFVNDITAEAHRSVQVVE